jgi:hypothetical protein
VDLVCAVRTFLDVGGEEVESILENRETHLLFVRNNCFLIKYSNRTKCVASSLQIEFRLWPKSSAQEKGEARRRRADEHREQKVSITWKDSNSEHEADQTTVDWLH